MTHTVRKPGTGDYDQVGEVKDFNVPVPEMKLEQGVGAKQKKKAGIRILPMQRPQAVHRVGWTLPSGLQSGNRHGRSPVDGGFQQGKPVRERGAGARLMRWTGSGQKKDQVDNTLVEHKFG